MKSLWTPLFVCLTLLRAGAQPASSLVNSDFAARNGVMYLFDRARAGAPTIVRVKTVYKDYETKGFFRIGVLPIGVLEGVTVELSESDCTTNGLARINNWLGKDGADRMELRQVKFFGTAATNILLQAERARVRSASEWELFDVACRLPAKSEVSCRRALLQVSGEKAGEVTLETLPVVTANLFALSPENHSKNMTSK